MASITQQSDLVIEVSTSIAALESDPKNKLIDCIKVGSIGDVVLVTVEEEGKKNYSKVIGWYVDASTPQSPKYKILLANAGTGAVASVSLN